MGKFDALHIGHLELAVQASKAGTPFLLSFASMAEVFGWENRAPIVAQCDRKRVLTSWAPFCGDITPLEYHVEFSQVKFQASKTCVSLSSRLPPLEPFPREFPPPVVCPPAAPPELRRWPPAWGEAMCLPPTPLLLALPLEALPCRFEQRPLAVRPGVFSTLLVPLPPSPLLVRLASLSPPSTGLPRLGPEDLFLLGHLPRFPPAIRSTARQPLRLSPAATFFLQFLRNMLAPHLCR